LKCRDLERFRASQEARDTVATVWLAGSLPSPRKPIPDECFIGFCPGTVSFDTSAATAAGAPVNEHRMLNGRFRRTSK
jgi:hypothetical protein